MDSPRYRCAYIPSILVRHALSSPLTATTRPSRICYVHSFIPSYGYTSRHSITLIFSLLRSFTAAFFIAPLFLHFWYSLPPFYPYALGDLNGYLPHSPSLLERGTSSACVIKMPNNLARSVCGDERAN